MNQACLLVAVNNAVINLVSHVFGFPGSSREPGMYLDIHVYSGVIHN